MDRLICFLFNLKTLMRKKVSNTSQMSYQAIEYQNLEAIYGIVINLSDNYFGNHKLEHLSSFSMYFLRCGEETGHGILHIAYTYSTIFFLYLLATFFLTQPRMWFAFFVTGALLAVLQRGNHQNLQGSKAVTQPVSSQPLLV